MIEPRRAAISRFQSDLAHALARRGQDMLDAPNLAETVPALPLLEVYFVVKELGVVDAVPILRFATSEQLQAIVDLDCWQTGDRPNAADLDTWLGPFAAQGYEALCRAFFAMDPELQTIFLAQDLTIFAAGSEEIPEPEPNVRRITTADNHFVLFCPDSLERDVDPLFLVEALYRNDLEEAYRLLTSVMWESLNELEERAFQFREARLQDLGFVSRTEALGLLAPPPAHPPAKIARSHQPATPVVLPALYARSLAEDSLLVQAMQRLSDPEHLAAIEQELVYLINAAVIAFGKGPHDIGHVADMAKDVRDTVSLGLECLQGETVSASRAADLLDEWPLRDVFRHGYAPVARLTASTKAMFDDPVAKGWLERTSDAQTSGQEALDSAFVRALLRRPARHAGYDAGQPSLSHSFGSRSELDEAARRLDEIGKRIL